MSKFDELKKLAEAASRGPWEVKVDKHPHFRNGNHTEHRIRTAWVHGQLKDHYPVVTTSVGIPEFENGQPCHMVSISKEDAAYIAAANPAAILELLDIQAQLVEALKNARVYVSHEGDDEELGELDAALSAAGAQP